MSDTTRLANPDPAGKTASSAAEAIPGNTRESTRRSPGEGLAAEWASRDQ